MSQEITSQQIVHYSTQGVPSIESHLCVARVNRFDNMTKYYIKYFEFGPQRGNPVNPYGVDFDRKLLDRSHVSGDYITKYKECNKDCFDTYIKFLESQNDLFYRRVLSY